MGPSHQLSNFPNSKRICSCLADVSGAGRAADAPGAVTGAPLPFQQDVASTRAKASDRMPRILPMMMPPT